MSDQLLLKALRAENNKLRNEVRKHVESTHALLTHKQQIDAIFDNAPVELYLKDREGRYLKINKQFETIFKVKNKNLVGKYPSAIHDPELAASTRAQDLAVLTSGKIERREEIACLPIDDRPHTLLTIKFPVFDSEGEVDGLGAIVTDITDRKQAEDRFRNMVNTIEGVIWEVEVDTDEINYISESVENLLGYPVSVWKTREFWAKHIYTDDRDRVVQYCINSINSGKTNYELEYRFITSEGKIVWLRDIISVSVFEGKPRWLRGIMVDITEKKTTEIALRSAKNRFHTIFMSAPLGMALCDMDSGQILEINPAYEKIVGRSKENIQTIGWPEYTYLDDLDEDVRNLKRMQNGDISSYQMVKRFVKPDNSLIWTELFVTAIGKLESSGGQQYLAILEDITQRKQYEERIWQQANYDYLTGLPNRNMLHDRLNELIKKEKRGGLEFALLLIDLDQFKDVNDSLGHEKGDQLLVEAASRILHCVRESDTVARLGGDEFVIILSELSILSGVEKVAQSVLNSIKNPFLLGEDTCHVSASIGVTLYPEDGVEMVQLIKNADQAMYSAKNAGRNCYQYFTRNMQLFAHRRMQTINEMRYAIRQGHFELYYQPIVDLRNGTVQKAEALIRWKHVDKGLILPADFIPIAEETHLINEIGDWVFVKAARQVKKWKSKLTDDFQISVNVSPVQFVNQLDESWKKVMQKHQIDGSSLTIEITETLLMTSDAAAQEILLAFKEAGIQVTLDDFGTGYSSLAYLRKFDIDYLKIDQSFVRSLQRDSDDMALCAAIIVMAHKLGIKVIAEGIETDDQRQLLISINCDYGQGNYFSRPVPASDFEKNYRQ